MTQAGVLDPSAGTASDVPPAGVEREHKVLRASAVTWTVVAVACVSAAGAAWVLRYSPFPPNGLGGDQGFRIASIARDARSIVPHDFAYRDLPIFYPPLFFIALGRVVAFTGMPAYEGLKTGVIVVAFIVPLVGYHLWRRLTGDALLAGSVALAGLALHDWYEPYSWLAVVVFVPWWFAYVVHVDARAAGRQMRRVAIGSVIGAAIVTTYYYAFFIGAVHLLALLVATGIVRAREEKLPLRVTLESWLVLLGSGVLSSPFWGPLAFHVLTGAPFESLQNRFFEGWMIDLPLPFLAPNVTGGVMLFGLVSLVIGARRSTLLLGLATLLAAAYAWFVLGYVAVLLDAPVLAYKTSALIQAVLVAAAGIGAVSCARAVAGHRVGDVIRDSIPATRTTCLFIVILVLVVSSLGAIPYVGEQRAAREPTDLLSAFDSAMHGRSDDEVVLTADYALSIFRPVYLFNAWNAHYSNPTAEFTSRSRFLERLAREQDPAVFAAALRHNRYDAIGAVVLHVDGNTLTYTDYQDNFPRGTVTRRLRFNSSQFSDRWFAATVTPNSAVFVPRGSDAALSLDAAQRSTLRQHFAEDLP